MFFFSPLQGWAHRPRRATSQQGGELGHSERRSLFSRTLISLHLEDSQHHLATRITGRWMGGPVLVDLWHLFRTRRPVCSQASTGRWKPFRDIIPSLCPGDVYAAFRLRIMSWEVAARWRRHWKKRPWYLDFNTSVVNIEWKLSVSPLKIKNKKSFMLCWRHCNERTCSLVVLWLSTVMLSSGKG